MSKKRIFDELELRDLFENTSLSKGEVAAKLHSGRSQIRLAFNNLYSKEENKERTRRLVKEKRSGENCHMFGRTRENHPNFKSRVADGRGYWMVLKPDWYTGRAKSKHVFEHSVIMCQAIGLTEIPKGFLVHHVDGNTNNNDINNLALMKIGAHQRLHILKAQRLSEKSRDNSRNAEHPSQADLTNSATWEGGDIVYSSW